MRRLAALALFAALFGAAVLVLYGLGRAGLEAEERRLEADQRVSRGALLEGARRDVKEALDQVRSREGARPYYHWRPLFLPPELVAKQVALVPSPLVDRPTDPLVRLHLELRDGQLASPGVPDVPGDEPTPWSREAAARLAALRPLVPALEAQLGLPAGEPVMREVVDELVCQTNDRPAEALGQLARSDAENGQQLADQWNAYQSRAGKQSGQFRPSQRGNSSSAGVPVAVYPLRFVRDGVRPDGWPRRLLALRRVEVGARSWLQGVLLDADALRERVVPALLVRAVPPSLGPESTLAWARGSTPTSVAGATEARLTVLPVGAVPAGASALALEAPLEGLAVVDLAPATDPRAVLARGRALLDSALGLAVVVVVLGFGLLVLAGRAEARLARRRADFVAAMTHELKAPLTGLRALAELLHDDLVPDEQKKREYYAAMLGEAERLSRLVQNVLDASRLERGTLTVTASRVDLPPLLEDLAARFRPRLESEGFEVEVLAAADLPPVLADRDALSHVLGNLLDNAAKYGRGANGSSRVRLVAARDGPRVVVAVEDDGPGVPPDERARVFERFYRGRDAPPQVGGAGLGLTIARALARAMGGELSLEAAASGGARFAFALAQAGESRPPPPVTVGGQMLQG